MWNYELEASDSDPIVVKGRVADRRQEQVVRYGTATSVVAVAVPMHDSIKTNSEASACKSIPNSDPNPFVKDPNESVFSGELNWAH